jgi:hypothetical protein
VSHLLELVDECDRNKDGKIDFEEWQLVGKLIDVLRDGETKTAIELTVKRIKQRIPMAESHLEKVNDLSSMSLLLISLVGSSLV